MSHETPTTIPMERLETLERVAQDIKKEFRYNKHTDLWAWMDRDDLDFPDRWHDGFKTRLEALEDAVEPYINEED